MYTASDVRAIPDIWYKDDADRDPKHRLDLYLPPGLDESQHSTRTHHSPLLGASERTPPSSDDGGPERLRGGMSTVDIHSGLHPVIMFVHGGGWRRGDRRFMFGLYGNVGQTWAANGFIVAVISYRLARLIWLEILAIALVAGLVAWACFTPVFSTTGDGSLAIGLGVFFIIFSWLVFRNKPYRKVRHPAQVQDCAHALKWIMANVGRYHGDPNNIFLAGHSAGGHLVSLLALDDTHVESVGIKRDVARSAIRGVFAISAPLSHTIMAETCAARVFYLGPVFGRKSNAWEHAFPLYHCRKEAPPFLLLNSSLEAPGLHRHTPAFVERLKECGVPVESFTIRRTDHLSIIRSVGCQNDSVTPCLLNFIEAHSRRTMGSPPASPETETGEEKRDV